MIGGFLFLVLVVAALALGVAFFLDTLATKTAWKKRALYAAGIGSAIPMLLPVLIVFLENGNDPEIWIVLFALVIIGIVLAATVGFPVAYWFSKRREAARGSLDPAKDFE